jgi:hypothetical protein
VYLHEARELVHFSAKIVNSNAEAFGVRLGQASRLPLPYVSVRCLMDQGMAPGLDYIQNPAAAKSTADDATKKIDAIKQIRRLQSEDSQTIDSGGEDLAKLKLALDAVASQSYASPEGLRQVSPRLRQLLLPKGEGYVALTPLPSAGLSQEINRRMKARNAEAKEQALSLFQHATLGIGGANPQNVGALVRETQTAWVFSAPTENCALRAALAIHFRGIPIRLPRKAMLAWKNGRERAIAQNGGRLPTDMDYREQERKQVLEVAGGVLRQGQKALRFLEQHREILGDALLAETCADPVARGLIDPSERGKAWPADFGQRIADAIGAYTVGEERFLLLDGASLQHIARWIEELVR